jgi:Carboxypeptidase regulatory-like domain
VRFFRSKMAVGATIAVLAAGLFSPHGRTGFSLAPAEARAQNLGMRAVSGSVVDSDSKPVAGATVFLRYIKNKSIRSFTTEAGGRFRFTQVNMAEDHELWAEKDGKKSPVKTVSQWDARKEFETELKLK